MFEHSFFTFYKNNMTHNIARTNNLVSIHPQKSYNNGLLIGSQYVNSFFYFFVKFRPIQAQVQINRFRADSSLISREKVFKTGRLFPCS
jgi:hypothetical protein